MYPEPATSRSVVVVVVVSNISPWTRHRYVFRERRTCGQAQASETRGPARGQRNDRSSRPARRASLCARRRARPRSVVHGLLVPGGQQQGALLPACRVCGLRLRARGMQAGRQAGRAHPPSPLPPSLTRAAGRAARSRRRRMQRGHVQLRTVPPGRPFFLEGRRSGRAGRQTRAPMHASHGADGPPSGLCETRDGINALWCHANGRICARAGGGAAAASK